MRCRRCRSAHRAPRFDRRLSRSAILATAWLATACASTGSAQVVDTPLASRADALGVAPLLVVPTVNGARRDVALLVRDSTGRYYADDAALIDWRIAPPYP